MRSTLVFLLAIALQVTTTFAEREFRVSISKDVCPQPASGRLVLYLIRGDSSLKQLPPSDGPFWHDPQPLYGIDVKDLKPGEVATIDDRATAFGPAISQLEAGEYRVQAVLDMHKDASNWGYEAGNLFSEVLTVTLRGEEDVIDITLSQMTKPRDPPPRDRGEVFEVRSKLLSDFRQKYVMLRAGVVFPDDYDASRSYPVVYEVPGFGGNHYEAFLRFPQPRSDAGRELARNSFRIVLDPESPNGHTLFADSDVNGPCGQALTRELIPALEAKYKLIAKPSARLLRGHSSGGWSVLWLAMQYPDSFGACWSSSPDPVDFRRFELIDIYKDANAYFDPAKNEVPSTRTHGNITLSVRGENQQEEVLGPGNTSGQQWDSWQAVFGSRDATGWPKPLFDAHTGTLDHAEAEHYRKYDIGHLLRTEPQKYGPIFLQRIRLICGEADDYYLNEAVALLQKDLESLAIAELPEGRNGYVKMIAGMDHSTVFMSPAMRNISQEMLDHLREVGHLPAEARHK